MNNEIKNTLELSTFAQFYRALNDKDAKALLVAYLQDIFLSKNIIEPVTGEPNIMALSHLATAPKLQSQDKFTQLLSYCDAALKTVINHPRYKVVREHDFVPIHKAQQLDNRSVQWLSRQPGNNIRQKLSANPHVLALTRRNSLDTLENRFVHNTIQYLDYLLESKRENIGLDDEQDWLAQELDLWGSKEEVKEIKAWQAMPPNNVLLEDKNYQKIWRVGNKLNRLDDEISHIYNNIEFSFLHRLWLEIIAHLQSVKKVHVLESMLSSDVTDLTYKHVYGSVEILGKNLEARGSYRLNEKKYIDIRVSCNDQESKIILVTNFDVKKYYTINISSVGVVVCDEKNRQIQSYSLFNQDMQIMAGQIVQSWLGESGLPRVFKELESDFFATINLSSSIPYVRLLTSDTAKEKGSVKKLQSESPLPLRFLAQKDNHTGEVLDLSLSTAIDLDQDAELLTYGSVYDEDNASVIVDLIAKGLKTPRVNYLVSDYISDFDSKVIRSEFNRAFYRATPLPKSIAAVFAMQAKTMLPIKKGELYVVLEQGLNGLYATPVIGQNSKQKIYWERHPSFKLDNKGTIKLINQALKGEYPQDVIDAFCSSFSYAELIKNNRKPAIKYRNNWYTLSESNREKVKSHYVDIAKSTLSNSLKENGINGFTSLNIITLDPSIKTNGFDSKNIYKNLDITHGSQALFELMSAKRNTVYWRDHLPKLLTRLPMEGREVELVFVDDKTTIEPKRGKRISLELKSKFTIPAGKTKIALPIFQGQGKDVKRYSLTLEHSAFPLAADIECTLDLGYTYGDEEPYQLVFSPVDNDAPFNQVIAKWSSWEMTQEQKRVCPEYPQIQTVSALSKYSSQGKKETDILEWSERVFNEVHDYYEFLVNGKSSKRISVPIDPSNYFKDKNGNKCQKLNLDIGEVFIHQAQFEGDLFDKNPIKISGDLIKSDRGGYKLQNITDVGLIPMAEVSSLSKRWRFPILTLFDQEREMLSQDFPRSLSESANLALNNAVELLSVHTPSKMEQELRQFISYFHRIVPESFAQQLIENTKNKTKLRQSMLNISYALGDCSTEWQKRLLSNILIPIDDIGGTRAVSLEILGTAIWRSKSLVFQLTSKQINVLVNRVSDFITKDELNIESNDKHFKWNSLLRRLELVFALIRLRASDKQDIASSMEVGSVNSDKLLHAIQLLNKNVGGTLFNVMQANKKVKCRVHLDNIIKPKAYNKTPDLLYALNMYLSGDDGASSITISEISSE